MAYEHDDIENVDHGDIASNPNYIGNVLQTQVNRRQVLSGGAALAASGIGATTLLAACGSDNATIAPVVNVKSVARSKADRVVLGSEYQATVLLATGDPINAAPDNKTLQTVTADEMLTRAGDHHDGMYFYPLDAAGNLSRTANDRGLLVMNFENINQQFLHATGATADSSGNRTVAEQVRKEIRNHGVGVIEVRKNASGVFQVVAGSPFARRITPETEHDIRGPVAGSKWVKTKFSPTGVKARGTLNNCAYGYTPWGTYLTCEENWAFYFDNKDASSVTLGVENTRYGQSRGQNGSYRWATATGGVNDEFTRWNFTRTGAAADGTDDYRNEPNTFGWNVEIDPIRTAVLPVKRTALGRMAHECAYPSIVTAGRKFAFYQGDDSRFEYIFKFVPTQVWNPADAGTGVLAGNKYLDDGILYAAKLNSDGTGSWLPLVQGQGALTAAAGFADQAEVLVKTRSAADAVGATKMDRPEWCSVDHTTGDVYVACTNNTNRGVGTNPGVDAANPRVNNQAGHIVRIRETASDPGATTFNWEIFAFASAATNSANNLSALNESNDHASPDGLWNDPRGLLWIQTDNGHTNEMGLLCNNQMLVTIPSPNFGSLPELRRFLVGPSECEITGIDMTPDGKTMFMNVQHPGEDTPVAQVKADDASGANYSSSWPYSRSDATLLGTKGARPRSATIVITRKDGGVIGM